MICRVVKEAIRCYTYAKAQSLKVRAMNEASEAKRGMASSHVELSGEEWSDAGSKDAP